MSHNLWMIGGLFALITGFVLLIVLVVLSLRQKKTGLKVNNTTKEKSRYLLLLYQQIARSPLTRHAVSNIRSRIEIVGNKEERTIRIRTVRIFLFIILVVTTLFITIAVVTKQLLLILLSVIVLWFLAETLVDFFVIRLKNRLLKQQIALNDLIRHKYYETGMVDEAIYQACQSLDRYHHEIGLQGQRIHDILVSRDVEKEIESYNDTAPNKFLKLLMGLAYITTEYGDSHVDGSSVFMKNLSNLTGEIRIELSKREQLNYALKSLNVIVLVPLFCITPIRRWASSYFLPLQQFYDSEVGFFLQIITVVLIFGCYLLLRRIQYMEDNRHAYRKHEIESRLYLKGLHPVIDVLKPKGINYQRLSKKLKTVNSAMSVEVFTVRRILTAVAALIFGMGVIVSLHYGQRQQVLTAPTIPEHFLGGQLSYEELEKAQAVTAHDNRYLSQMTLHTTEEEVLELLGHSPLPDQELQRVAKRLVLKQEQYFSQYIKWWEVLLVMVLAVLCYWLPMVYLSFQRRVISIDIEDEVAGYSTIILMLMHHERLAVTDILEWMEMFSSAFKEPISDCLNNTSSGLTEALLVLGDTTDNERFAAIISSLVLASEDITIRQAFEELSTEKSYYMEERKELNRRIVEKKVNLGRMVGFVPLYGMIVLYMIIPMIVASMTDMEKYFNQLNL